MNLGQGSLVNGLYSAAAFLNGKVHSLDLQQGILVVDYGSSHALVTTGSCAVWIYDTETKLLSAGSIKDIQEGDFCFAKVQYLSASELILYR